MNYIVKKTTVWGNYRNCKSFEESIRRLKKHEILRYPFVDHLNSDDSDGGKYAYKPSNQKGPAKENQTFLISYAYNYDHLKDSSELEQKYINELSEINMRFYKEKCVFRGHDAYKILILENDIDLESLLKLL